MIDYNRSPRSQDPTLEEMTAALKDTFGGHEPDAFDIAQAIHWFCVEYHSGMSSNLYAAQCQQKYRPGLAESGPEPESLPEEMYYFLVGKWGGNV